MLTVGVNYKKFGTLVEPCIKPIAGYTSRSDNHSAESTSHTFEDTRYTCEGAGRTS
jgi:hypothetical protein